jgi:hypothetical protein
MPIQEDIRDHGTIDPMLRQERADGQMELLLNMIEKKFGAIPARTRKRIEALKPDKLKNVALRLLDARRIEDLFAR